MKSWKLLVILLMLFTVSSQLMAAPLEKVAYAPVDARFGIVESYVNPAEANNLGVAWTRVRFQWAEVQAGGPGSWNPAVSDAQINGEIANGRMVVGLLIGIPDWARENGLPAGLHLPHTDPNNSWATFVREAVNRYHGRINHWIIWNEPDINDPSAPGHTWNGSTSDFFQLQRTAYLVAKEANPNAVIHLPAFTYFWNPNYIYEFLDVVVADPSAPANNYYFDAVTAHLYFQPDSVFSLIQSFYGAVQSRGIPWKPVWLVETNAPPTNDPTWPVPNWTFQVMLDEQAAYIPQALAVAMAAGAQRIAIYKMQDLPTDVAANPEPFGLLRMDGSRRPAFNTYQVAIRYLAGAQGVRREQWNEIGRVRLDQGSFTTHVLFSRLPAPQQAQIEATAQTAVLVDMWGSRQTISARDGYFTVDLPGALCVQTAGDYCMIGGTVFYLVQNKEGGAAPDAPPGGNAPPPAPPTAVATGDEAATVTVTVASEGVTAVTPTTTATTRPTKAPATATPRPSRTPSPTPSPTATETATAVPSETPPPTNSSTPVATEVAAVAATATSTAVTSAAAPSPAAPSDSPVALWLMGAAVVLALGLAGWWWRYGRG